MRRSIRYQLLTLFGAMLVGTMVTYLWLASRIVTADKEATVYDTNALLAGTVADQVESSLEKRLSALLGQELQETGGVEAVAEVLNLIDRSTERGILENLEEEDPDLVDKIRRLMFVFEDIILVNDKGIQNALKEVEHSDLALALKTASEELKQKFFNNMSARASELVKEDMEYLGPVRVADVEQAQQQIVDIIRKLEESGDAIIQGRGGGDEMLV